MNYLCHLDKCAGVARVHVLLLQGLPRGLRLQARLIGMHFKLVVFFHIKMQGVHCICMSDTHEERIEQYREQEIQKENIQDIVKKYKIWE